MSILFVLGTVRLVLYSSEFETMFVEERDFPGGPSGWLRKDFAVPVNIMGEVVLSLCDILTDSVQVCRTRLILAYELVFSAERISSRCTDYGLFGVEVFVS